MQENIEKPRQTNSMSTPTGPGFQPSPSPAGGRSAYQPFPEGNLYAPIEQGIGETNLGRLENPYPIDTGESVLGAGNSEGTK